MAARLENLQDALAFLRLNKIENFVARTSSDKDNTLIFKSNPENTVEENYDRFREVAEMTAGSFFIIEQGARGAHRIEVKNERKPAEVGGVPTPMVQGFTKEEVQAEISAALKNYKIEQELEQLRAENRELSKEVKRKQSVGEQFMERLTPYVSTIVPVILNKLSPNAGTVAVAGLAPAEQVGEIELSEEDSERVERALQKWASADADFIEYIEAFAEFAASGKTVMGMDYAKVKSMFGPAQLRGMLS